MSLQEALRLLSETSFQRILFPKWLLNIMPFETYVIIDRSRKVELIEKQGSNARITHMRPWTSLCASRYLSDDQRLDKKYQRKQKLEKIGEILDEMTSSRGWFLQTRAKRRNYHWTMRNWYVYTLVPCHFLKTKRKIVPDRKRVCIVICWARCVSYASRQ